MDKWTTPITKEEKEEMHERDLHYVDQFTNIGEKIVLVFGYIVMGVGAIAFAWIIIESITSL